MAKLAKKGAAKAPAAPKVTTTACTTRSGSTSATSSRSHALPSLRVDEPMQYRAMVDCCRQSFVTSAGCPHM